MNVNSYCELSIYVFAKYYCRSGLTPTSNLGSFIFDEILKWQVKLRQIWYQHLRDTLDRNNLLYVIYITVRRNTTRDSAGENDDGDYHDRRSLSIKVQSTVLHS